jgi:hypothetical protein
MATWKRVRTDATGTVRSSAAAYQIGVRGLSSVFSPDEEEKPPEYIVYFKAFRQNQVENKPARRVL